jgi:hypothetical protein
MSDISQNYRFAEVIRPNIVILFYKANTPRGIKMINHALSRGVDNISSANGDLEQNVGMGRTVLHIIAALWGDLSGVHAALEMGADPTIFDALGYTPLGLARKGGYDTVVATLVEGVRKAPDDRSCGGGVLLRSVLFGSGCGK